MQTTSDVYKRILTQTDYVVRRRAVVNGVAYEDDTGLVSMSKSHRLYTRDALSVGGVAAAEYNLSLHTANDLPRLSRIELFVRLEGGGEASEWIPKGTGYSATRKRDRINGCWVVTGFDALLLSEETYLNPEEAPGEWPQKCRTVVEDICRRLGLLLDDRTVLRDHYVGFPEQLSMRSILGYIAAMHGGNWTVTDAGALYLVPLVPTGERQDLSDHMEALYAGTELGPFTGVQFVFDGEVTVSAGDDSGRVLEIECPWATDAVAADVLSALEGFVYRPYEADSAVFDPAMELGDPVSVDGVESVLASVDTDFDLLCTADITAPTEDAVENDFPFVDKKRAELESKVKNNEAILWTGIDQADHLSTSQKIAKYLREDTSEDDFLRIKGLGIVWIRARTDGTEVQATDEDGHPLYWDPDVEKATVEADGWYYVGTEKVKPTIVETPYPVMCYAYEEQVIAEWKFMQVPNPDGTAAFLPTIVMGAGTDVTGLTNNGKAFLQKHFGGIDLKYQTSAGKTAGAFFRDDGFVDVVQRRASISVDTANTTIVVRPEGELADSYAINYNEDEAGNLNLIWPDGYQTRVEVL